MKEITRKSERNMMIGQYRVWQNSSNTELYHIYGKFSQAKINAFERCKALMQSLGGEGLRILGHNCDTFSVGFEFPNPETGAMCFAYITKDYDRFIELTWKDGELI